MYKNFYHHSFGYASKNVLYNLTTFLSYYELCIVFRSAHKLISKDLRELEQILNQNPQEGVNLGNNCFKIRLKNSSIPTGKSGGFRVIYYLKTEEKIYLLEIYSKSDLENIEDKRLVEILLANGLNS